MEHPYTDNHLLKGRFPIENSETGTPLTSLLYSLSLPFSKKPDPGERQKSFLLII